MLEVAAALGGPAGPPAPGGALLVGVDDMVGVLALGDGWGRWRGGAEDRWFGSSRRHGISTRKQAHQVYVESWRMGCGRR